MEPILYESHMHTPLCKHAAGQPQAYAAVAEERGLKGIIVTCHNPPIDGWSPHVRMSQAQFGDYVDLVAAARRDWAGRIDVRLGMECDYAPHMEEALAVQLQQAEFHHVLGSIHPQLSEYRERYGAGDDLAFQATYFEHLAQAAESGLFDTLAHPDLIKNEVPSTWKLEPVWENVLAMLDRVAAAGVAMELNTSGLQKRVREMNPGPQILAEIHRRRIPIVLGADAHEPKRVAADYDRALEMLQVIGFDEVSIFLNRQRQSIPISAALESLCQAVVWSDERFKNRVSARL